MDEQRSLDVKSDIIYWILLMLSLYKGEIIAVEPGRTVTK